jgi:hypothetical protein
MVSRIDHYSVPIAEQPSHSVRTSRSFTLQGDTAMIPNAVPIAEQQENLSVREATALEGYNARCFRLYVHSAGRRHRYLSNRGKIDLSIAATAITK